MLVYIIIIAIFIAVLLTISSRVRKAASLAFEREEIETDEFSLVKPEGLIYPVNRKSDFAFHAYSKEFGKGDAEERRQAQIFVSAISGRDFSVVCKEKKKAADRILSEETSGGVCLIEAEETRENVTAYNFYKIVDADRDQKIFILRFEILKEALEDYRAKIDETLESFRLK